MRIPAEAWEARRRRSLEVWSDLLERARGKRADGGRHPNNPELAHVVEYHGTPTPAARTYVADRLRGDHPLRDAGRPPATATERRRTLRRASTLHRAVEERRAAFKIQGAKGPKSRALDYVASRVGISSDRVRRIIREYLAEARLHGETIIDASDAEAHIRDLLEEGAIRLDPDVGWVEVGAK